MYIIHVVITSKVHDAASTVYTQPQTQLLFPLRLSLGREIAEVGIEIGTGYEASTHIACKDSVVIGIELVCY